MAKTTPISMRSTRPLRPSCGWSTMLAKASPDMVGGKEGSLQGPAARGSTISSEKTLPDAQVVAWMSLPNKTQLFILALCRLSEPLSNTCLLPYIYFLIRSIISTSKDDSASAEEISRLSGLLVAAFPIAQFATSMLWGRLSDSYGRKPIIIIGLVASVLSNLAFGFSKSIGALMFWRVLAGLGNGNVGVMRTMTAEIVKERKYQSRAFLILPLVFNSGMVAGLALGGCLADPVVNLPWLFGPKGLFNIAQLPEGVAWALQYPYALPAISNAVALGISLILAIFGLKETLPGKEDQRDLGIVIGRRVTRYIQRVASRKSAVGYTALELDDSQDDTTNSFTGTILSKPPLPSPPPPPLAFSSIWTREILVTLLSFGLLPLHNAAFMHIFPVFLCTPPNENTNATFLSFNGGLGLSSPSVGLWLSFFGICGIFLQLFIYPRMQAKLGTLGCFRVALFIFPFAYLFAPYLSFLTQHEILRYICIAVVLCVQVMARTIAIPSTVILLTNAAPAKNVLGTIHGAGNMLSCLARAVGTAAGGWVFAWGMENDVVGAVWWFYLTVIAVIALACSYAMKVGDGPAACGKQAERE